MALCSMCLFSLSICSVLYTFHLNTVKLSQKRDKYLSGPELGLEILSTRLLLDVIASFLLFVLYRFDVILLLETLLAGRILIFGTLILVPAIDLDWFVLFRRIWGTFSDKIIMAFLKW